VFGNIPGGSRHDVGVERNPWLDLPAEPPYVLSADRPHVEAFNRQQTNRDYRLDLQMIPEPFGGNREAQLLFLNRNPGAGAGDVDVHRTDYRYVAALRANLGDNPKGHVSVALLPEFAETPAGRWCSRTFRAVIERACPAEELARRILGVEFHGYHSVSWRSIGITLPSQRYGFWLVEQAIARRATIVIARGKRDWEVAVPALHGYEHLVVLTNPRSSAVSERNCGPEGLDKIIAALL
jgi:hypothetical protein